MMLTLFTFLISNEGSFATWTFKLYFTAQNIYSYTEYSMSSVGGWCKGRGYNERTATRLSTATTQGRAGLGAGLAASCSHSQSCSQLGLHWFSI